VPNATFVAFTAQTRMSGVDLAVDGVAVRIRKGAAAAVMKWVRENGGHPTEDVGPAVDGISASGGTPLVVAECRDGGPARALGVIHLKDVVKTGMRERFDEMRRMGIRTVMITGDNHLTAKAIADEAGVDDFLAEAKLPDPADPESGTQSLLTQVCTRSKAIGELDGVDGSRPFCTPTGVGAVLAVFGPRGSDGRVAHVDRVVSVNEACPGRPFISIYEGVAVECGKPGEDYAAGQIVPVRGGAAADPAVPADAVTASGSGLDPGISPAYARLQAARVARARGTSAEEVLALIDDHITGRALGFIGEPSVNVLALNIDLDRRFPTRG